MDEVPTRPRLLILSKGAQRITTLPALLPEFDLVRANAGAIETCSHVLAWGRKPSAYKAIALAAGQARAVLTVEDGFLRSVGLGADEPPLSLVVDDTGVYYDASSPSRLERLIAQPLSADQHARATRLCQRWRQERVSKYNQARFSTTTLPANAVLVADQTFGDASLQGAGAQDFAAMLQAAMARYPDSPILLKVHPDVIAGRKRGHFDLDALAGHGQVQVLTENLHPADLLPQLRAVFTMTSQLGFDALLWGVPVHTWGMPFYAGWGLTDDRLPAPQRRHPVSLEQLVHAALVTYPRYVDPETGQACEVETLLAWLGLQRRQRSALPARAQVMGFSRWKEPLATHFFAGAQIRFVKPDTPLAADVAVLTWGCKHDDQLTRHNQPVCRVEDGFLRSVGLGAGKARPLSWVIDDLGIYYDATRPSRLERLLAEHAFDAELLERAAALRTAICAQGVTKYNLPGQAWQRPAGHARVLLVTGQVEADASIRFGAHQIRSNLALLQAVRQQHPDAYVLYKPHPEVLAGTRAQGGDEAQTVHWCNEVIADTPFQSLLEQVDEVHVLTSQSGFEALLRGVPVTTWGQPFYAGWGLTQDCSMAAQVQARRTRRLTLDQLVAATLLLYPTYVSRVSNRYTTAERTLYELQHWHALPEEKGPGTRWQEMKRRLKNLLGMSPSRN